MKSFETVHGSKQECRLNLIDLTRQILDADNHNPVFFTLPSREHICYDLFKESFKNCNIVSVEKDRSIAQHLNNIGIFTECVDTTTYFKDFRPWQHPFTTLFLDYYSFCSESVIKDLEIIANSPYILREGFSAIGVTLSKPIRRDKDEMINRFEDIRVLDDQDIGNNIDTTVTYICDIFNKNNKNNCNPEFSKEYTASDGSMPMYFISLSVKR